MIKKGNKTITITLTPAELKILDNIKQEFNFKTNSRAVKLLIKLYGANTNVAINTGI